MTRGRLGAPDARRFSVYRNNVAVGLIGALEALSGRAASPATTPSAPWRAPSSGAKAALASHDRLRRDFPEFVAAHAGVEPCLPDVARLENAWVEAYHAEDAPAATIGALAELSPDCLPGTRIAFHPAARLLRFSTPAASIWASRESGDGPAAPVQAMAEEALVSRPDSEVRVRILPPLGYEFALSLREERRWPRPRSGSTTPSSTSEPISSDWSNPAPSLPHSRKPVMNADAWRANALAPSNPIARLTGALFGLIPAWLPLLLLRLTLARPFFASGLTRWDRLVHSVLRHEDPVRAGLQAPRLRRRNPVSAARRGGGDGEHGRDRAADPARLQPPTRWAALGLLCMTAVIELTYPDAWPDYHLPWATMALAIMTFGPGAASLDRLFGFDGWRAEAGATERRSGSRAGRSVGPEARSWTRKKRFTGNTYC